VISAYIQYVCFTSLPPSHSNANLTITLIHLNMQCNLGALVNSPQPGFLLQSSLWRSRCSSCVVWVRCWSWFSASDRSVWRTSSAPDLDHSTRSSSAADADWTPGWSADRLASSRGAVHVGLSIVSVFDTWLECTQRAQTSAKASNLKQKWSGIWIGISGLIRIRIRNVCRITPKVLWIQYLVAIIQSFRRVLWKIDRNANKSRVRPPDAHNC